MEKEIKIPKRKTIQKSRSKEGNRTILVPSRVEYKREVFGSGERRTQDTEEYVRRSGKYGRRQDHLLSREEKQS